MALHVFNSMSGAKELFQPEDPTNVRIYNCGPTVYNFNHIGNFRAYAFVDLLRRYLKFRNFGVEHSSNITDVDDKIIQNAMEKKQDLETFTEPYIQAFFEDLRTLKIQDVEHRPRATRTIDRMHEMIQVLEKKDHTYTVGSNVYFRITSYSDYGKLSRIDPESLKAAAGGRFDADEYTKENVRDFALWKSPDSDNEPGWESPWGFGRPGWHLECSAMIRDIYGKKGVDIHCGGIDLLFPHHENEIAQSCAAYPDDNFVKYWMHNEHLLVEGKKMSKSMGNFFTLRDLTVDESARKLVSENRAPQLLLDQIRSGHITRNIRYLLTGTHYRIKLNFTFDGLHAADSACDRMQSAVRKLMQKTGMEISDIESHAKTISSNDSPGNGGSGFANRNTKAAKAMSAFIEAMDDDLNISKATASIFDFLRDIQPDMESETAEKTELQDGIIFLYLINQVLDVIAFEADESAPSVDDSLRNWIEEMIEKRKDARKNKDFAEADNIRDELLTKGIEIKDTPQGTTWNLR